MEPTGDQRVDDATSPLADIAGLTPREQLGVFESVHAALQARLAEAED